MFYICYYIEFIKSKKEITSSILIKDVNNNILKTELLNQYRTQIKLIKNKIDKHSITVKDIKKKILEISTETNKEISTEMIDYIVAWINNRFSFKFYETTITIVNKNYVKIQLLVKNNSKILYINLKFAKWTNSDWCSDSYELEISNGKKYYYNDLEKVYSNFISRSEFFQF